MSDYVEDWEKHRAGSAILEELDTLLEVNEDGDSTTIDVDVEDVRRALQQCLNVIAERNA